MTDDLKTMTTETCFTLSRSPLTIAQEKSTHARGVASKVAMPLEGEERMMTI
jgi:hypothetical protein